jgi:hypothetical protein
LRPSRRQLVPAAVAGVLVVIALLLSAATERERVAASNTRTLSNVAAIPLLPGEPHCHGGEHVPAAADRLRVWGGMPEGRPGQPLRVEFQRRSGMPVFAARVERGWDAGAVDIPLPADRPELELARVCFENLGDEGNNLVGNLTSANPADGARANGPDQPQHDVPRLDFLLPEEAALVSVAGRVSERSALFRPGWQGAWAPWLALLALLAVALAALRRLWLDAGRGER